MARYCYEDDIAREFRRVWFFLMSIFAIFSAWCIFLSTKVSRIEKPRECVVEKSECEHNLTSILGELDSLAKFDVCDSVALRLMSDLGIQHKHIVLAQMKLESGNYQSKLAKENNNYFGMRHPAQRLTVSVKSKNGYAHYRNWCYSILDYALWQRRYAYDLNESDYLTLLSNVYAEDKEYVNKVSTIAKNICKN